MVGRVVMSYLLNLAWFQLYNKYGYAGLAYRPSGNVFYQFAV